MNIEICKRCSKFPKYFIFDFNRFSFENGEQLKFIGQDKNWHSTGCYFYLNEEQYNKLCNVAEINRRIFYNFVKPEDIIINFINKECIYKFEHEVVDE
jgi:hypothetical protein